MYLKYLKIKLFVIFNMYESNALIPKQDVDITSLALSQLELELLNKTNNLTTDSIIELQKIKTQNKMLELLQMKIIENNKYLSIK